MDNLTEQLKKYKRSLKAYAKKIKESGGKYRMRGEGREVAGASHVVCSFFFPRYVICLLIFFLKVCILLQNLTFRMVMVSFRVSLWSSNEVRFADYYY